MGFWRFLLLCTEFPLPHRSCTLSVVRIRWHKFRQLRGFLIRCCLRRNRRSVLILPGFRSGRIPLLQGFLLNIQMVSQLLLTVSGRYRLLLCKARYRIWVLRWQCPVSRNESLRSVHFLLHWGLVIVYEFLLLPLLPAGLLLFLHCSGKWGFQTELGWFLILISDYLHTYLWEAAF